MIYVENWSFGLLNGSIELMGSALCQYLWIFAIKIIWILEWREELINNEHHVFFIKIAGKDGYYYSWDERRSKTFFIGKFHFQNHSRELMNLFDQTEV